MLHNCITIHGTKKHKLNIMSACLYVTVTQTPHTSH